jgi:hypothetical protein
MPNIPFVAALTGALLRCSSLVWLATRRSERLALHPASTPTNGTLTISASLSSCSRACRIVRQRPRMGAAWALHGRSMYALWGPFSVAYFASRRWMPCLCVQDDGRAQPVRRRQVRMASTIKMALQNTSNLAASCAAGHSTPTRITELSR